jgi:hypothetical protein
MIPAGRCEVRLYGPFYCREEARSGVTNPIVARLTLQNFEILQRCAITKEKTEKLQSLYLNDLTPAALLANPRKASRRNGKAGGLLQAAGQGCGIRYAASGDAA